jgi:hypothetical protein
MPDMFRLIRTKKLELLSVLSNLKVRALRSGLWFSSLSYEDRVLAGLVNRNIRIVKNAALATVIARIIGKLLYAMKNTSFLSRIVHLGTPIAREYSAKAHLFGNKDALDWAKDEAYIRYWGTMAYHNQMCGLLVVQNKGGNQ